MNTIPPHWTWVKLGDVIGKNGIFVDGDWVESKDQDTNGEVRLIQLADIGEIEFRNKSDRYLTHSKALELKCTFIKNGDLLVARMPDPLGRTCIFPLKGNDKYVTVVDVAIIRVENGIVDNKFLCYTINAPQSRNKISELQSGSTRKRISRSNLGSIHFPLPPLPEQKKIVEKIEELFSHLDSGVASLKKAKEQIRLYRQSMLASAFSGKLVREVGGRQSAVGKTEMLKAAEPKVEYSNQLPDGWKWVRLDEVIDSIQYGTSDKAIGNEAGIPVLRMGNIQDGKLDYSSLKFFDKSFKDLNKYILEDGDILFNRTNSAELVGKSAIYKKHHPKSIFASYLIRVKVAKSIYSPEFLNYYINSSYGRDFIKSVVSQNVGQANVNGTKLKAMLVPLVPMNQQTQIVEEIEKRFSEADNLEKTINESLIKAETLKQSILKQAFEGRLV